MSENIFGLMSIPVITVICYLMALGIRITPLDNKFLPVICGVLGGILGIVAMFVMLDFPANDPMTAVAVGIVSGLAATGAHQIFKQMGGGKKSGTDQTSDGV